MKFVATSQKIENYLKEILTFFADTVIKFVKYSTNICHVCCQLLLSVIHCESNLKNNTFQNYCIQSKFNPHFQPRIPRDTGGEPPFICRAAYAAAIVKRGAEARGAAL